MLVPLLMMFVGFTLFFVAYLCVRLRAELLRRERQSAWVREKVTHA
jgi:ABC-type transport system involved in cytochrome c biogenesis permease subunit